MNRKFGNFQRFGSRKVLLKHQPNKMSYLSMVSKDSQVPMRSNSSMVAQSLNDLLENEEGE